MTWQDYAVEGEYSTPSLSPIDPKKQLPEIGELVLAVIDPYIDTRVRHFNEHVMKRDPLDQSHVYNTMVFFRGFDEENYPIFQKQSAGFMNTGYVDDSTIVCYYKMPKVTRNNKYQDD